MSESTNKNQYNILLLTNRNSDNTGDQVIEASDIALIGAAMKNLGIDADGYKIRSEDASIISKKYTETRDRSLLERAYSLIDWCDLVFFGGAPQFNYLYQTFYDRTATIIEIAKELGKNVVFSAIGVETYHEDDPRCQRLKETLNYDNVKRITTRDGYDLLEKYRERPSLFIDKVADPAVFTKWIFRDFIDAEKKAEKPKIGLFIIRAGAFSDNGIKFPWRKAAPMWLGVIEELTRLGYDYELITNGHFGDEAFLDRLVRDYDAPASKSVFDLSNPETLVSHISGYSGVISCRLHPSIVSYSLGVPSVSLVWNPKVRGFYEGIGYPERLIDVSDAAPETICRRLQEAMDAGVVHDREYMMSVYNNIYYALRDSFDITPPEGSSVYSFDELISNLEAYPGTSEHEQQLKDIRKMRRMYGKYNDIKEDLGTARRELRKLKAAPKPKKTKSLAYRALRKIKRTITG